MNTNCEKAEKLGILDDLLENNTTKGVNQMDCERILGAWLEWEGIIGYTHRIMQIVDTFYEKTHTKEDLKQAYMDGSDRGKWFRVPLTNTTMELNEPNFDKWFDKYNSK